MLTEDEIADAREQFLQECRPGGKYSLNFKAPCITCKWAMCNAGNFADSKAKEEHEDKCVHHPSFCEFCREVQEDPQHVPLAPTTLTRAQTASNSSQGRRGSMGTRNLARRRRTRNKARKARRERKLS